MDTEGLAALQRQASIAFLEGDVKSALSAWRQILQVNPEDRAAREGMRLCEQWADEVDPAQEIGSFLDPEAGVVSGESQEETAPRFDLGQTPPLPGAAAPEEAQADAPRWSWGGGGEEEEDPALSDGLAIGGSSEELVRRVQALIADTESALELGNAAQALSCIERVLILDEMNETALALRRRIAGEAEADEARPLDLTLDENAVHGGESPCATAPSVEGSEPGPPPLPELDLELSSAPTTPEAAVPAPASRAGLSVWFAPPRVYAVAGLVLLVVGFAGFAGWTMLAPGATESPANPRPSAREPRAADNQALSDPASTRPGSAPTETTPAPVVVAVIDPDDPARIRERADAAMQAGDYAAAIVEFDRLLALEPKDSALQISLQDAAEKYREQQARRSRWDAVAEAFETRNYREALRILYRLPRDVHDPARIDELIRAAWYNLGVEAVQAGDCPRAVEHLEEARGIGLEDPPLLAALELALDCGRSESPAYPSAVRGLPLRPFNP